MAKKPKRKPGLKTKLKQDWKETKESAADAWSKFKIDIGEDYSVGKKKATKGYKKVKRKLGFKTKRKPKRKNPDDLYKGKPYVFEYADPRLQSKLGIFSTIPITGRYINTVINYGKKIVVLEVDDKEVYLDANHIISITPLPEEGYNRRTF